MNYISPFFGPFQVQCKQCAMTFFNTVHESFKIDSSMLEIIAESHFAAGNVAQAKIFAKRAQGALKRGTPTWRRMDELIAFRSKQ